MLCSCVYTGFSFNSCLYGFWLLFHPQGMMTFVLGISWFSALIVKTEVRHFPLKWFFSLPFFQTLSRGCQMTTVTNDCSSQHQDNGQKLEQHPAPCWELQSLFPQSWTSWFGTMVQLCHWQGLTTQLPTPTAFQACLKTIYFILQWRFCHENKGIRNTLQFTLKSEYQEPWLGVHWVQLRLQSSWRTLDVKKCKKFTEQRNSVFKEAFHK